MQTNSFVLLALWLLQFNHESYQQTIYTDMHGDEPKLSLTIQGISRESPRVLADAIFKGSVSEHFNVSTDHSVEMCLYLAISESFDAAHKSRGYYGFPTNQYRCITLTNNKEFQQEKINMVVDNFNPGTYCITAIIVDLQISTIYMENSEIFDVSSPPENSKNLFEAPAFKHVKSFWSDEANASSPLSTGNPQVRIALFLKDLDVHGCNMRMLRAFVHSRQFYEERGIKTPLQIITPVSGRNSSIGEELETIDTLRIIYVLPELLAVPIDFENRGAQILLKNLHDIDVVLAANTMWDELTEGFMLYVNYLKQAGNVSPVVILDLCNLPALDNPSLALWRKITHGFIAPSVFVGMHPWTLESGKPIRVVYPSVSKLMASEEYHNSACKSKLQKWPRRVNGKFRVGCIGRLTFERSPGICILLIAEIVSTRGRGFVKENIEFVITSSGFLLKKLYNLARVLDIHELITFTGFVPDITEVLSTLDVAVNTIARGENFGILNTESVISCTPVIAFNRSATQESLSIGVSFSLLVQDVSLSSLVAKLLAVLDGEIDFTADMLRMDAIGISRLVNPDIQSGKLLNALKEFAHASGSRLDTNKIIDDL